VWNFILEECGLARFKVYKDNRGEWRWTFYADGGEEIAVSSEGYVNHSDCLHSIEIVRKQAPGASEE